MNIEQMANAREAALIHEDGGVVGTHDREVESRPVATLSNGPLTQLARERRRETASYRKTPRAPVAQNDARQFDSARPLSKQSEHYGPCPTCGGAK